MMIGLSQRQWKNVLTSNLEISDENDGDDSEWLEEKREYVENTFVFADIDKGIEIG